MSYAFVQDVPVNEDIYWRIRDQLGDTPPPGLVAHIVIKHEHGLRHVNVWESEQTWQTFHDETLAPALTSVLAAVGVQPDASQVVRETVEVVDAWVQGPTQVPTG